MDIKEHVPLAPYTTFHIGGPARYLIFAQTDEEVLQGIAFAKQQALPFFVMGGGSNILVSDKGYDGVVIRVETVGIDIAAETDETIELKVASGEVWDDVVRFAVEQEWWGIENLSHIPGFTGAFAVQNVGAYGQEASQVVIKVDVLDTHDMEIKQLQKNELQFSYRSSIFNGGEKHRYIILHTYIQLHKQGAPNLSYKDVANYFEADVTPTINEIRTAVIQIRNTKFPFPDTPEHGNAGSFFRGPLLTESEMDAVVTKVAASFGEIAKEKLVAMLDRLQVPQGYKTPAAFLIDVCGLKGFQVGGAIVNKPQPAIILNYTGEATSDEVMRLYQEVVDIVTQKTGITLGHEPEFIGF